MQPLSFIAGSAEEAVAQIRTKLGPEAVVLNVRQLLANGLARLWQKPMIEVMAHVPEPAAPEAEPVSAALADVRQQLREIRHQVEQRPSRNVANIAESQGDACRDLSIDSNAPLNSGQWRVGAILQKAGLLPLHAQGVLDQLRAQFGEMPPETLGEELALARKLLSDSWRYARPLMAQSIHVLIGPAGSGKTTYLCKWLTQAALVEGRSARVWRLDGATANTAESLSVHCEILGVPAERVWSADDANLSEDIGFIDLPGVDWRNPLAIKELAGQVKQFGLPRVHLVLNGAYDISILPAQVRAFAGLPIEDLVITHLDEELHWGKLWNLTLGTNCSIRHFSTGQNIPGDFCEASPEAIFSRQFARK